VVGGRARRTCASWLGESLQPQPAPWEKRVRRGALGSDSIVQMFFRGGPRRQTRFAVGGGLGDEDFAAGMTLALGPDDSTFLKYDDELAGLFGADFKFALQERAGGVVELADELDGVGD
jgi:hypothetical protein